MTATRSDALDREYTTAPAINAIRTASRHVGGIFKRRALVHFTSSASSRTISNPATRSLHPPNENSSHIGMSPGNTSNMAA